MTITRGQLVALLLVCGASASTAFHNGGRALRPRRVASTVHMVLPSPAEALGTLITAAADVSDDFDINSLPAPAQGLISSYAILVVPIGAGILVASLIIAFLIWSMGGI